MSSERVDRDHLTVTEAAEETSDRHVTVEDDVTIVVTQAFGPEGHELVGLSDETFDGYPAVTILVRADGREGQVHLSPVHGDARKEGFTDIPAGTRCELLCPVTRKQLDYVGTVGDGSGAHYYAIYLTPKLSRGQMVAISDIWGHYHSRIVDDFELISAWANAEEELEREAKEES